VWMLSDGQMQGRMLGDGARSCACCPGGVSPWHHSAASRDEHELLAAHGGIGAARELLLRPCTEGRDARGEGVAGGRGVTGPAAEAPSGAGEGGGGGARWETAHPRITRSAGALSADGLDLRLEIGICGAIRDGRDVLEVTTGCRRSKSVYVRRCRSARCWVLRPAAASLTP
jgi:hypothetical protein